MMEAFHRSLRQPDQLSPTSNVVAALDSGRQAFAASDVQVTQSRDGSSRPTLLAKDVARDLDQAAFVVLGTQHPFS